MHKSKLLALLLAVAMVASMVVVPVYAADSEIGLVLIPSSTTVAPGDTVDVTVRLDTNPGFNGLGIDLDYPDTWTLDKVNKNLHLSVLATNEEDVATANVGPLTNDPIRVALNNAYADLYGTGNIIKYTFTVPGGASGTETISASVDYAQNLAGQVLPVATIAPIEVTVQAAGGASTECPVHGEVPSGWTEVDGTEVNWSAGGALTTGHYKLTDNVSLTAALTVAEDQTVCIDLNGHNITAPGTSGVRAFEVYGKLNIVDSAETDGVISGGVYAPSVGSTEQVHGGNILVSGAAAEFNLYGGTVSGGSMNPASYQQKLFGANIGVTDGATFNMHGGTVQNGEITYDQVASGAAVNGGGNISAYGGSTVNIHGGTISGGEVKGDYGTAKASRSALAYGGNVYVKDSILTVDGGTISGGYAHAIVKCTNTADTSKHTSYVYGGNICAESSTVTISGGLIENGHISAGSNLASSESTKTIMSMGGNIAILSGSATISGGTISGGYTAGEGSYYGGGNIALLSVKEARGGSSSFDSSRANVTVQGGTFVAYDGTAGYRAAHIYNHYSDLTLKGNVTLSGGIVSQWGGQVYTQGGTCTIYDGVTIESGTSTNGNALASNSGCVLTIYGGDIGQLYSRNPENTIYGGVVVEYGTTTGTGYYTNIYNGTLNSLTNVTVSCTKAHVNGGNVWHAVGECDVCGHTYVEEFTVEAPHNETTHKTTLGIHSYENGTCTICGAAEPVLDTKDAECQFCGGSHTWTKWDGTTQITEGHYYLAADVEMLAGASVSASSTVCLDLGGFELTAPAAARAFSVSGTLNIMNGTIKNGGAVVAGHGGMIYADIGSNLKLKGVTVSGGKVSGDSAQGGNLMLYGATVDIEDCVIENGTSEYRGGNIYITNSGSDVTFTDTTIRDGSTTSNTAGRGGNVSMANGTVDFINCTIANGVVGSSGRGGNMLVMGSAVVTVDGGSIKIDKEEIVANEYGGNIYVTESNQGTELTLKGGVSVTGGKAGVGGNICSMYGELNLLDCEISGGVADSKSGGGNISIYHSAHPSVTTIRGAEITDGSATHEEAVGGNIRVIYSTPTNQPAEEVVAQLTIDGNTVISGGTAADVADDVYIPAGRADWWRGEVSISNANVGTLKVTDGGNSNVEIGAGVTLKTDPAKYLSNCVALHDASEGKYVTYAQLADALTASGEGDTVTLGMNVADAGAVELKTGVTLDLNGKTLAADSIDAATNTGAHIVDNNGTGKLAVESFDYAGFAKENNMLPVAVDGGYAFETPVLKQDYYGGTTEHDATQKISFYIANEEAKTAMKDAAEREGEEALKIGFFVTYAGNETGTYYWLEKDTEAYDAYLANWDTKMIVLTLTGCDTVTNLEVKGCVQSGEVVVYYEVSE